MTPSPKTPPLIRVGIVDFAGGFGAENFGSLTNLALGGIVLIVILALTLLKNKTLQVSSIFIGMLVGYIVAIFLGQVDFSGIGTQSLFAIPIPFKYGFAFDFAAFLPIAFIYLITAIESTGDLTATSMLSGEPVEGDTYIKRIKGGVLGDGVNSLIAATFNTFPNTTFSQNNGVIQMTGIASRYVGYFVAAIFVILGLFPIVGGVMQTLPKPVLGGATIVLFGSIAAAGIRILASQEIDKRKAIIIAVSLGLGIGISLVPDVLKGIKEAGEVGKLIATIFGSAITTSGITAIVLSLVLPKSDN